MQIPEVIDLSQSWRIGEQVGGGGFATVYLAWSDSVGTAVAKFIPKSPGADRELLFEDLSGVPNVVPVLDQGETKHYWVIVMPKAEKSLRHHLEQVGGILSPDETVQILIDISEALVGLKERVVHRDIKPDNILLLNGHWCLADFGISRYADATTAPDTRKYSMTPPYAAPEQWRGAHATNATDIYATGVVAYELLAGRPPFSGLDLPDYRRQHLEDEPAQLPDVPVRLRSLVAECLVKAPGARPEPNNLLARLGGRLLPTSQARQSLQQAHELAIERQGEASRQESLARSAAERRVQLSEAARPSLESIIDSLCRIVEEEAPARHPSKSPRGWISRLNDAYLTVEPSRMTEVRQEIGHDTIAFEVIAHSNITLRVPADRFGYQGRSHSLWYCDAQEAGIFRWYETTFMSLLSVAEQMSPFDLRPGKDSYLAISPVVHSYQVAWPFTPIDQGGQDEFIERWIGWFAEAAKGNLRRPRQMPERPTEGSWRRKN